MSFELQTVVTMENLPSLPRQLPTLAPRAKLSLTHTAGSADLAAGKDSWCQAGQTTSCSLGVGEGRGGRKEVQELRVLEQGGALENHRLSWLQGKPHCTEMAKQQSGNPNTCFSIQELRTILEE